jgi:hypothetical protein
MNTNRRTSLVLAAAVAAAFALPAVPAHAATFTFNDSSCASFNAQSDGNGGLVISCGTSQPSNCALSASPTTVPATGGTVTLTSSCGTVTGWTKNGTPGGTVGTTWQDSIPATTSTTNLTFTYAITGSNGQTTASVVQTGTGTTGGTGGTTGPISCTGFTNTRVIPIAWGALQSGSVSVYTKNFGGFSNGDIVVASFTTPMMTSAGQTGAIQAAENATTAISRTASLSTTPCSFDTALSATGSLFASITGSSLVKGNTVTVSFQVGGSSAWYPVLQPGKTYYYNIKNTNGVGSDMKIELQKPPGL